jgi:hypothetical protein
MREDHRARVLTLYAAVNAGDLEAVSRFDDSGLRGWAPSGDHPLIAEGDMVVVRITSTGTHQGDFYGLAPAG